MSDVVDYGPLKALIGTWEGDKGMDVAPEPAGIENSPYYETIVFEAGGDLQNAEEQTLAVVRYHQQVRRKINDEVFHDEVGYWLWDGAAGVVMQSFTIPRGVALVAGGHHNHTGSDSVSLSVEAKLGDPDWSISQSPFMRDKARTVGFSHSITVEGNSMRYSETTMLEIYGRSFEHTDNNELKRVS